MLRSPRPSVGARAVRQRRLPLAIAAVVVVALAATACTDDGDPRADEPVQVHVPPGYEEGTPAPLLLVLHGYALTSELEVAYFGATEVADARGMLLAAPDGTKNAEGKQFWNATDACCAPEGSEVDDSAYLAGVIDDVSSRYDVDDRRVFVLGHSNGGFMAYRLACDHADKIAGVASLEGAMVGDSVTCEPSEPVTALEIHGTTDQVIRYDGGTHPTSSAKYPGAVATVEAWAGHNGCDTTAAPADPPTRELILGLPAAQATTYPGCEGGAAVELWTQPAGGHTPPLRPEFTSQVVDWLLAHPKP